MTPEEITDKIAEIDAEMEELTKKVWATCDCDNHLELRKREFGQGSHFVYQCNKCGNQKGNSVGKIKAHSILNGKQPQEFDSSIAEKAKVNRKPDRDRYNSLQIERFRLVNLKHGAIDYQPPHVIDNKKREEASAQLIRQIENISSTLSEVDVVRLLVEQVVRLKKKAREEAIATTHRFADEDALKNWFVRHFAQDFDIFPEVPGVHLAEKVNVRIDFMLRARSHLVDLGFDERMFGVEVKYFSQDDGFTGKTSRGLWQAISYNDCEFDVDGVKCKPKFCLMFSNLSFESERNLIKNLGSEFENDKQEWRGMLHLANHARVGTLDVRGDRDNYRGWEIRFVGGVYFTCSVSKSGSSHRKSNDNVINKVRIGNSETKRKLRTM